MLNFEYNIPTKVFFGKGQIKNLASQIKLFGNKILLVYGGGSIKKIGLYNQVLDILNKNQIKVFELNGIIANPSLESVRDGIKICRENNIQGILAVGGGSVIDASKAIAAGAMQDGDVWDFFTGKKEIKKALPFGTILTLSATGSEMDPYAVITNYETEDKLDIGNPCLYPSFSILDPEYTFTVNKHQTAAGIVDIMSHVFEQYFSPTPETFLIDTMSESILKTCIKYGPVAIDQPTNYDARAELMRASSWALNGFIGYGKRGDRSSHMIEHTISAVYPVTHGDGLAILFPNWMNYVLNEDNVDKFCALSRNIRGLQNNDKLTLAKAGIQKTRDFFISIGAPAKLSDVGIGEDKLEILAQKATMFGDIGSFKRLNKDDVMKILKLCL